VFLGGGVVFLGGGVVFLGGGVVFLDVCFPHPSPEETATSQKT